MFFVLFGEIFIFFLFNIFTFILQFILYKVTGCDLINTFLIIFQKLKLITITYAKFGKNLHLKKAHYFGRKCAKVNYLFIKKLKTIIVIIFFVF